jgi:hypothetical protein
MIKFRTSMLYVMSNRTGQVRSEMALVLGCRMVNSGGRAIEIWSRVVKAFDVAER